MTRTISRTEQDDELHLNRPGPRQPRRAPRRGRGEPSRHPGCRRTKAAAQGTATVREGRAGLPQGRTGSQPGAPRCGTRPLGTRHDPRPPPGPEPREDLPGAQARPGQIVLSWGRGHLFLLRHRRRVRDSSPDLGLLDREREVAVVLRRLLPHPPARHGEQARLRVVVTGSRQSAKPGSESVSTWRNGTRASSWLSTPMPPAKVRWMSMYAGGRFSRSITG